MRSRLIVLLVVASMAASTLLPAVAAEGHQGEDDSRHLAADAPDCPDWEGVDALEAAKTAEIVAEALKEAAPRDLVLGAVVAGEGEVSTDGPNPLYVLAYVGFKAAQEAALIIEMNHERYLECENEAHWELLRLVDDKIDELTTTVETDDAQLQTSIDDLTTIVETNDAQLQASIDNLTTIVETDDAETLRIEIENALYPCKPLVGFYLPIANGGQLETVRDVVDEGITGSAAAGFNVGGAQAAYNNAVNIMNQGAYRDAFVAFCAAYGQLVASSGGGNTSPIAQTFGSGYLTFCVNYYTQDVTQSRSYAGVPPLIDTSTLCNYQERPLQVLGWYYGT